MADGVRIQHPTERDVMYTIVDGSRLYQQPYDCPTCGRVHVHKTYHISLDTVGAAIVSDTIAKRLEAIPNQPFQITGSVSEPPAQRIVVHGADHKPRKRG